LRANSPLISISIISHGQINEASKLLRSLSEHSCGRNIEILLTENVSPGTAPTFDELEFPLRYKANKAPLGFARNHNRAFEEAKGDLFLVLNPDILFTEDVFGFLLEDIESGRGDIVSPMVLERDGTLADSFRSVPRPLDLIRRRMRPSLRKPADLKAEFIRPEWLAGMFLLMRQEVFRLLDGFDERYHMYFEDVDLGCRARLMGKVLLLDTRCSIIHDARRASQRQMAHALWHLRSAIQFFTSPVYRRIRAQKG
jgi:GT2 family glycosyltransferase